MIARVEASAAGQRQPVRRHQPRRRAAMALRGRLLRPRPSRESDQGAQAPPRLRPDLVLEGDGQPVPPAGPHRRLLAAAHPARPGAQDLVLARRPVRHHPPRPDQGGRPGHRDGHPDQGRACPPPTLTAKAWRCSPPGPSSCRPEPRGSVPPPSPSPQPTNPGSIAPSAPPFRAAAPADPAPRHSPR